MLCLAATWPMDLKSDLVLVDYSYFIDCYLIDNYFCNSHFFDSHVWQPFQWLLFSQQWFKFNDLHLLHHISNSFFINTKFMNSFFSNSHFTVILLTSILLIAISSTFIFVYYLLEIFRILYIRFAIERSFEKFHVTPLGTI